METSASLAQKISDIRAQLLNLDHEILRINIQLSDARTRNAITKDYADAKWYRAASVSLRYKGLEKQRLQNELAGLNKELAAANRKQGDPEGLEFSRKFMRVAKNMLGQETYMSIILATKEAQ